MRLVLAALALVAGPAVAGPLPAELGAGEAAVVGAVPDGETLELADGRTVRLAVIAAPRPILPRTGAAPRRDGRLEALAAAARSALDAWSRGRTVRLHPVAPDSDRHGRVVAHVVAPGGTWLQAALAADGLARVETLEFGAAAAAALLQVEAAARAARRGIWSHPLFQVRSGDESGRWLDTFQLVEGPVAAVHDGRSASRIEIGDGARRLTVVLTSQVRRALRQDGIEPADLVGREIRVRGWIGWLNGPRIELPHPAALELAVR